MVGGGQGGHPDPPKKHFRPSGPQFGLKITGGAGPLGPSPESATAIAFVLRARDTEAARERRINTRKEAAPKFRLILQPATEAIKIQTEPSDVNALGIFPMKAAVPKKKPCQEPMTLTLPIFFLPFFWL